MMSITRDNYPEVRGRGGQGVDCQQCTVSSSGKGAGTAAGGCGHTIPSLQLYRVMSTLLALVMNILHNLPAVWPRRGLEC